MKVSKYSIIINNTTPEQETAEMIYALVTCKITRNSICLYDISEDLTMTNYIKSMGYDVNPPLLFLWGNYYGGIEKVQKDLKNGSLRLAVMNNPTKKRKQKKRRNRKSHDNSSDNDHKQPIHTPKPIGDQIPSIPQVITNELDVKDVEIAKDGMSDDINKDIVEKIEDIVKEDDHVSNDNELINKITIETCQNDVVSKQIEDKQQTQLTDDYEQPQQSISIKQPLPEKDKLFQDQLKLLLESYHVEIEEVEEKYEVIIVEDYENQEEVNKDDDMVELNVPENYSFSFGDRWLNSCEWVFRTLSQSNIRDKNTKTNEFLPMTKDDVDFYVVRTNWYWRHQLRVIRCGKDCFWRLDTNGYIKEVFHYEDISEIIQSDDQHVVLKFSVNSQPQFLQCSTMKRFIKCLQSHIKHQITYSSN
ncbi:Uncharacterized protein QTN25_004664 [Entamoeba marina]